MCKDLLVKSEEGYVNTIVDIVVIINFLYTSYLLLILLVNAC